MSENMQKFVELEEMSEKIYGDRKAGYEIRVAGNTVLIELNWNDMTCGYVNYHNEPVKFLNNLNNLEEFGTKENGLDLELIKTVRNALGTEKALRLSLM